MDQVKFCRNNDITVTAYAPLGGAIKPTGQRNPVPNVLKDPTLLELTGKYKKTPAQIALKYIVEKGIITIPKSVNPTRIRENIQLFDWELESDDVEKLKAVNIGESARVFNFDFLKGINKHPEFPF